MGNKVILWGGIVIVALATWFAFTPPSAPLLPAFMITGTSSSSGVALADPPAAATDNEALAHPGAVIPPATTSGGAGGKIISIHFMSPTSSSELVIGAPYDITWSVAGGIEGQLYLVDAGTGRVVGWIEQHIGPAQVMYPWDARSVFVSATSPAAKDITPGNYQLRMSFSSPQVKAAESAVFTIVATTTTE